MALGVLYGGGMEAGGVRYRYSPAFVEGQARDRRQIALGEEGDGGLVGERREDQPDTSRKFETTESGRGEG